MMPVVAFMPVRNEADILASSLRRLIESGVMPFVLDNWSTDGSWEIARACRRSLAGLERYPPDGRSAGYDLVMLRTRIAELATRVDADWYAWNDADEYLHPAWPSVTVIEALKNIQDEGFNAVEQVVAVFPPIDDAYRPGSDFVAHFRHWRPQPQTGSRPWIRMWKNTGKPLRFRGGNHEIDFEERRVAPVPFVLRHYPLRSQQHALRKIFVDRLPRFSSNERGLGWHTHYDMVTTDQSFLENAADLHVLDESTFAAQLFAALGRRHLGP